MYINVYSESESFAVFPPKIPGYTTPEGTSNFFNFTAAMTDGAFDDIEISIDDLLTSSCSGDLEPSIGAEFLSPEMEAPVSNLQMTDSEYLEVLISEEKMRPDYSILGLDLMAIVDICHQKAVDEILKNFDLSRRGSSGPPTGSSFDDFDFDVDDFWQTDNDSSLAPDAAATASTSTSSHLTPSGHHLSLSPSKRGRRRVYHGQDRRWATWRNNWVYNERKKLAKEMQLAKLKLFEKRNSRLNDELFRLFLLVEGCKDGLCGYNMKRVLRAGEGCPAADQVICQCLKTKRPCLDSL